MSNPKFGKIPYGVGTASQMLAVNSMQNIAKLHSSEDADLSQISDLLRRKGSPLTVVAVAEALAPWKADKVAERLALGGRLGMFAFCKDNNGTTVTLTK